MQHGEDETPGGQNQAEPPPAAPWSITQDPEKKEITNLKLKVLLVVSSEKIKPRNIRQEKGKDILVTALYYIVHARCWYCRMQRKITKCNTVETNETPGGQNQTGPPPAAPWSITHNSAMQCFCSCTWTQIQKHTTAQTRMQTKHHIHKHSDPSHRTMQCSVAAVAHKHKIANTHTITYTHIQPHTNTNTRLHNVIWKGSGPVLEWWFAQFWKHSFTLPLFVSKGMKLRHMFGQPLTGDLVRFLSFIMILKISMVFLKVLWWESHN